MNSEIQETIAELRALIRVLEPMVSSPLYSVDEIWAVCKQLEPLLKKLEEHLIIMEKKNERHEKHALPPPQV